MRINSLTSMLLAAFAVIVFASVGCEKPEEGTPAKDEHAQGDGHGSAHDHPPHGPFNGHIFDLDSPDHQGEWKKYKDNNIIRMYILDGEGKKAAPEKVDSFIVKPQAGKDEVVYELAAEDADENGASATYMLDDNALTIAIPLGVDIEIKIGDKTIKGQIKAHEPLDH